MICWFLYIIGYIIIYVTYIKNYSASDAIKLNVNGFLIFNLIFNLNILFGHLKPILNKISMLSI